MTTHKLRGHHIKNLSIALNFRRNKYNNTNCAYILNSSPEDLVMIVANEREGFCQSCYENYPENYQRCQINPQISNYDADLAKIWGFEVGQVYSVKDLVSRLRPASYCFIGIAKTVSYLCKLIIKEIKS